MDKRWLLRQQHDVANVNKIALFPLFSFARVARGKGEEVGGAPSLVKGRAVDFEAGPLP